MESGHATGFFLDWGSAARATWYFVFDNQYYYKLDAQFPVFPYDTSLSSSGGNHHAGYRSDLTPIFPGSPNSLFPSGVKASLLISANYLESTNWVIPVLNSSANYAPSRFWSGSSVEHLPVESYFEPRTETLVRHPSFNSSVSHTVTYWLGFVSEQKYNGSSGLFANHKVRSVKQGYYPPVAPATKGVDYRYQPPFSSKITIESISYGSSYTEGEIANPKTIYLTGLWTNASTVFENSQYYYQRSDGVAVATKPVKELLSAGTPGQVSSLGFFNLRFQFFANMPAGYVSTGANTGYATDSIPYSARIGVSAVYKEFEYSGGEFLKAYQNATGFFTLNRSIGSSYSVQSLRLYNGGTQSGDNYIQLNNVKCEIIELVYEDPAFSPYFGNP